ncbi:MAG: hypothetical protein NVS3B1_06990 [Marmoricola sp.]
MNTSARRLAPKVRGNGDETIDEIQVYAPSDKPPANRRAAVALLALLQDARERRQRGEHKLAS